MIERKLLWPLQKQHSKLERLSSLETVAQTLTEQ